MLLTVVAVVVVVAVTVTVDNYYLHSCIPNAHTRTHCSTKHL